MASESSERPDEPVVKFESMLKTDDIYFFDAEDFEDIVHHYLNNGKISLAKKAIKIGLQQHPASIELKLLDVEILVFENNFDLAEKILDELQLLDSQNQEIYVQRANIYSKKDDHEAAVILLHKAYDLAANGFEIQSMLGMEYLFMDDFKKAKECFMKCLDFDEHDYSALYNVVYCFEFLDDFDGAIYYLNDYLDRNPYCEVAWHQLGKQYAAKKQYADALTAYDFAIFSDDTFMGAYFEKGKMLEKLGRFQDAIENYEATIKMEDPTSQAYLRIGRCYERLRNDEMAKYYFYHTVHEDPLLDKGWLAITDFYFKKRNYKKALYYINKAINIDGENAQYWKKCAQINNALKNFHEADFAYKQTIELGNKELEIWLKWANVLSRIKDFDSAIQILDQGMEFYPGNAKIAYKKAGFYLLNNDEINARICLVDALKNNLDQLSIFQKEFPQFYETPWVSDLIAGVQKASK